MIKMDFIVKDEEYKLNIKEERIMNTASFCASFEVDDGAVVNISDLHISVTYSGETYYYRHKPAGGRVAKLEAMSGKRNRVKIEGVFQEVAGQNGAITCAPFSLFLVFTDIIHFAQFLKLLTDHGYYYEYM